MIIEESTVWLIMSKDRKFVAKGTPRNREIVSVHANDKKRYLTYSSKAKAEAAFKVSGFYGMLQIEGYQYGKHLYEFLEAVECKMKLETINND